MTANDWCRVLGVERADLAAVKDHREANTYARLLVALLERGGPMTLAEVAGRFEEVGIAPADKALLSLRRCKPGRAPVYRDGDHYSLDPHDGELRLWVFRLGLVPPMASPAEAKRRREAHARALAVMSRALLVAFPAKAPRAAALLDVGRHEIHSFVDDELDALRERLTRYDILGAEDVRALLRALGVEGGSKRLAELGPPQKSVTIDRRGRSLKITTAMLVQGSCGVSRPFGDPKKMSAYLEKRQLGKLRRRLEADVKSLFALYEYGRLHGGVRLRWGFLDELIPAPWKHQDEPNLYELKRMGLEHGLPLEVVVGRAPGWAEQWSRSQVVVVREDSSRWGTCLVDEDGYVLDEADIQRARLWPEELRHA